MSAKNLAQFTRRQPSDASSQPSPRRAGEEPLTATPVLVDSDGLAVQFLRSFHLLLRSVRLYHQHHPRLIDSLKSTGHALDDALSGSTVLRFTIEHDRLAVTKQLSGSGHPLGDGRGELKTLAEVFSRASIRSLTFVPHTRLDELLQFARAVEAACRARSASSREDWVSRLREHRITGIRVNEVTESASESINFAGLLEALLGGSNSSASGDLGATAAPDQFRAALRRLWASAGRLGHVRLQAPREAARAIRDEFAGSDGFVRSVLMRGVALEPPRESESLGVYLARVADALSVDYARSEFFARRLRPAEVRMMLSQLRPEREGHQESDPSLDPLVERFWSSLPAREQTRLLASQDAWCLPVSLLRDYLEGLIAAAESRRAEASRRQARRALADFARCLDSEEEKARRAVVSSLLELKDVLERIWPCPQLADLGKSVVAALHREVSPGIANLLEQLTLTLATLALARGECGEVETILMEIDQAPPESDEERLAALTRQIVGREEWLLLVDLALANRALGPALPRLLRRDPERLLDRLRLLLTSSAGSNTLPAMARLVRAAGEPVIGALETHLLEPRRQRVATAIKLLSAAAPERLIGALPRAFPSWDWSLQDLAVTELVRQTAPALRLQAAESFLTLLRDAHLLVTPGMIDHIGIVGDSSAIPQLMEIAIGDAEQFGDVFIRIKAIEALGRMKASSAATPLRNLVRNRSGLTYAEPAGLRSAAEDALALIEDRAGSLTLRLPAKTSATSTPPFAQPRRYLRVALPEPLQVKMEGPQTRSVRVRSIALGGALLETSAEFALGESLRIEIHAGFEKIRATAVVRSISTKGCGIEFVHMKQDDREKLRRRINKLLD
jgi:PilZ domain